MTGRNHGKERFDAIVVLGAAVGPAGGPSAALRRRVAEGVRRLEAGAAPVLLLSGGKGGAINSEPEYYSLYGDEWQLDTRIIKWKSWANVIGLDSYYQLERLSGRYANIEQAIDSPPSAHQLTGEQKGLSIWKLKNLMKSNMPFLDAYFGQSIFVPMRDGAKFRVSLSQGGLVVRPVNESAAQALEAW